MGRLRWIILIVIVAGGALLLFRYTLQKERPDIPADEDHVGLPVGEDACMSCHGHDGVAPRGRNHPVGMDCARCHYWEGERR
jgi:hypothetical protein